MGSGTAILPLESGAALPELLTCYFLAPKLARHQLLLRTMHALILTALDSLAFPAR